MAGRTSIELDIPSDPAERERRRLAAWDRWYDTLPSDLRRRLSLHDFKRLGETFQEAFGIATLRYPPAPPQAEAGS